MEHRNGGTRSTLLRRIAWADVNAFHMEMVGYSRSVVVGGNTVLSRQLPAQHPTKPWLYCTGCTFISGDGTHTLGPLGEIVFPNVIYACDFEARNYDVYPDQEVSLKTVPELNRFVERKARLAQEAFQLPSLGFQWSLDSKKIPENGVKLFATRELTYIWRDVPVIPYANIETCQGKVNNGAFDAAFRGDSGYPLATLLLAGVDIDDSHNERGRGSFQSIPGSDNSYDITYTFAYKNNGFDNGGAVIAGWNHLFRTDGAAPNTWQYIESVADASRIYQTADFTKLFKLS